MTPEARAVVLRKDGAGTPHPVPSMGGPLSFLPTAGLSQTLCPSGANNRPPLHLTSELLFCRSCGADEQCAVIPRGGQWAYPPRDKPGKAELASNICVFPIHLQLLTLSAWSHLWVHSDSVGPGQELMGKGLPGIVKMHWTWIFLVPDGLDAKLLDSEQQFIFAALHMGDGIIPSKSARPNKINCLSHLSHPGTL